MKLSDYVAQALVDLGITQVFMISGGGAMHLNDSLGNHPDLHYACNHHEQACAMAAEGYFRASGRMAAVNVTSGPGGTNTITGLLGQWTDSIPALYISGQVKQETTVDHYPGLRLRQLGDQEAPIVDLVRPVTKWAMTIKDPQDIRWMLEEAIHLARSGRPGPVWLDIPLDIQGAQVEPTTLKPYPASSEPIWNRSALNAGVQAFEDRLRTSHRPLVVVGHGVRLSGSQSDLFRWVEAQGIPMVTTFNGFDLVPSDHPLWAGRIGSLGTRAGNFALQNADLILFLGTRNNIRQVSYNWTATARQAFKVVVDVDNGELAKPTFPPDLPIHSDVGEFLRAINLNMTETAPTEWTVWQQRCRKWRDRYPVVPFDQRQEGVDLNPYLFIKTLTDLLPNQAVMVAGNGTACVATFQAGTVKPGQRIFWNSGCASMGFDLPAAIGAAFGRPGQDIYCLAGDGSLQMNIQELQTMVHYRLPIKLFFLNNQGYQSIRQTQDTFFSSRYVACSQGSGVSFPEIQKLSEAYGIPSFQILGYENLSMQLENLICTPGPWICDVRLDTTCNFKPKLSSERLPDGRIISKPLEDMAPFLPREEFESNMSWDPKI